jgi:hypothetical protein
LSSQTNEGHYCQQPFFVLHSHTVTTYNETTHVVHLLADLPLTAPSGTLKALHQPAQLTITSEGHTLDHLTSVLHHTPLDAAQCSQIHFRQPVKCTAPRYFIVHYPLLPRKNSILLWCEIRVDTGLTTSGYPKYPKLKDILYHRLPPTDFQNAIDFAEVTASHGDVPLHYLSTTILTTVPTTSRLLLGAGWTIHRPTT